jgi:RNA polymerase sigma factor (sigma-70 family)
VGEPDPTQRGGLAFEREGLRALARSLVQDTEAEDVVHDAFATALEQPDVPHKLAPWLRQVVRNNARGRVRRARARELVLLTAVEPEPTESLEISLDRVRILDALEQALAALDEPYRSTVHARFFENLTPMEIARAVGDPPATVRWRVHEGLRRIRVALDSRFGGRRDWCAGLVVFIAPADATTTVVQVSTAGATPMNVTKLALVLVASGICVAIVSGTPAHAPAARSTAPLAVRRAASFDAEDEETNRHEPVAEAEGHAREAIEPVNATARDLSFPEAITAALETCLSDLRPPTLAGQTRLEVDLAAWTLEDGNSVIETLDVTTGRRWKFQDDVGEDTALDAAGVVVYDELAMCLAATIELDRARPARDGLGRIAAHDHVHPYRLAVPLDRRGGIDRAALAEAEDLQLVDVDDEQAPTPEDAVAAMLLPHRGTFAAAELRVVECGAYDCPFCKKSEATLAELEHRRSEVAVAFMHFPLSQAAARLAFAAVAAQRQDRFWEMHRALFDEPKPVDQARLVRIATELGLDVAEFERDLDDPATELEVARQRHVCEAAGVFATPTFFLNGDLVRGELGIDQLSTQVDEILADGE